MALTVKIMKKTEILIVGFGFSAIPLLRELDADGIEYTIISVKQGSIWARLEKSNALDFDLVSSYYASYYSFDLVDRFRQDWYPTAREFYDMHLRYYKKYADKIIDDCVTLIEDKGEHHVVHTKSGDCYQAQKVIISTAFKRKTNDSLNNFDFNISNKTVVINSIGDSANLMIAKLVTANNKIICLQNGFLALDKIFQIGDSTYSLDQLESHQLSIHFKSLYDAVIDFNFVKILKIVPTKKWAALRMHVVYAIQHALGKLFTPHNFHVPFESTRRSFSADKPFSTSVPNGSIIIKYWPIDQYAKEFSANLAESIQKGYLLNDIAYFIAEGLVTLWRKQDTVIDKENACIHCNGETINYDFFIDSDVERPNLPVITFVRDGETHEFDYQYRRTYLGVIQQDLANVYLLGYTRPLTGGLSNITEMQGLLTHAMLTDKTFYQQMRTNLASKMDVYDKKYYLTVEPSPRDHTVFFGFYTEEVAKELGINITLKSCKSLKEVFKYFTYPNNADKYRQTGRYKIDQCKQFVDRVYKSYQGFKFVWLMMLCYVFQQLITVAVFSSLFYHDWINVYTFGAALLFQYFFGYWSMILVANSVPFFKIKLLFFLLYIPLLVDPRTALLILPIDFLLTFILRQLPAARYPFNDLKNKKKYHDFFARYKKVYNQLKRLN